MVSQAIGGGPTATALPLAFEKLMRDCGISKTLPSECSKVTSTALSRKMLNSANVGMLRNAACEISGTDIEELATLLTSLPSD